MGSISSKVHSFLDAFSMVEKALPTFLEGAVISVSVVTIAMLIGFFVGTPLAVMQVYGTPFSRRLVALYAWFFRGVPILVLLYLFYFGLAYQIGLDITPFMASSLVLGLTSTAYQSQIIKGAIMSIPEGQLKAARAIGMSHYQAVTSIILPQAFRLALPGWSNEFSILLKDSALVSVLGTLDLLFRARALSESRPAYLTAYFVTAALLYFFITLIGTGFFSFLERIKRIPGFVLQ